MIEGGKRAGFALESQDRIPVSGDARRQDLDRDVAAEARIAGAIHLSHPSCAEERDDLVSADTRAGLGGNRRDYTAR